MNKNNFDNYINMKFSRFLWISTYPSCKVTKVWIIHPLVVNEKKKKKHDYFKNLQFVSAHNKLKR